MKGEAVTRRGAPVLTLYYFKIVAIENNVKSMDVAGEAYVIIDVVSVCAVE